MCTCNDRRWPETYRVMERSFSLCLMMLAEANFYVPVYRSSLPLGTTVDARLDSSLTGSSPDPGI
jgi:hypothetical protein